MNIEDFARVHPIAYVHIAYSVVWGLHIGYGTWMLAQYRKLKRP